VCVCGGVWVWVGGGGTVRCAWAQGRGPHPHRLPPRQHRTHTTSNIRPPAHALPRPCLVLPLSSALAWADWFFNFRIIHDPRRCRGSVPPQARRRVKPLPGLAWPPMSPLYRRHRRHSGRRSSSTWHTRPRSGAGRPRDPGLTAWARHRADDPGPRQRPPEQRGLAMAVALA